MINGTPIRDYIKAIDRRISEGRRSIDHIADDPEIAKGQVVEYVDSVRSQIRFLSEIHDDAFRIRWKYPNTFVVEDYEGKPRFTSDDVNGVADDVEFNTPGVWLLGITAWPYREDHDGDIVYHGHGPFSIGERRVGEADSELEGWRGRMEAAGTRDRAIAKVENYFDASRQAKRIANGGHQ